MGDTTAIAWTDHTFNPWMGCTKVSPACDHCYAEALSKRTGKAQWGDDAVRVVTSDGYWKNPAKWNAAAERDGVRRRVFCASMADVFEDRDELHDIRQRLFEEVIPETPWLDWQLLTKRPENVLDMVPLHWLQEGIEEWEIGVWPRNVWIGTTVENANMADLRLPALDEIPAYVRFVSCEPLLGPLAERCDLLHMLAGVDWVIVGGESGAGHRPLDLQAARDIRDACTFLEIPFFFKQVGGRFPHSGGDQLDGVTHKAFPGGGSSDS